MVRVVGDWLCTIWLNTRKVLRRTLGFRKVRVFGLAASLLLAAGMVNYECYLAGSDRPIEAYPALTLDGYHRLLVLAPHCDDEALGASGLIRAALRQGMDVRVVIATAGDSYTRAAQAQFRRQSLRPSDYIALGEIRQRESLDALARLGLNAEQVTFLAYPERGLSALWWDYWESDRPYRSPYSRLERITYPRAFHPGTPYSGAALLADLRTILRQEYPDLIVMPHPNDEHPDHRALSAFIALAVELERAEDPAFQPLMLGYLVHYGLYPQPFGLRPGRILRPPRRLETLGEWLQWRLSVDDLAAKREAVKAYPSQRRVSGYFLDAFVRPNEPFMVVDDAIALSIFEGETFLDTDAGRASLSGVPRRDDPVNDSLVRRASGAADIAGLHALRVGGSMWVVLELRGWVSRAYDYNLYVRAITSETTTTWSARYGRVSTDGVQAHGGTIWYPLDLETLGNPDWLSVAADVRRGVVIDQTAWYLIHVEEEPWADE